MAGRRIVIQIKTEGANSTTRDLNRVNKSAKKLSGIQKLLNQNFTVAIVKARLISAAYTNLKRAIDFGIQGAIAFEFSMKKVQAITGTTGESLASLEKVVRNLASVSPRTAAEVADTALAMAKLGLSSKEVEDALEGVIGLSVALDENVESVGQTLVAVKNVFQKEASELSSISDQLFTSFANSALNLDKFSTAFSFAGGAAKIAGVEFEELTALMGILANAGIRSSTIGTQLRSVFIEMSNSSSKFGKATGGVTIKQDGLVAALKALKEVAGTSEDAYRLFGKRALSVVDILGNNIDKFAELRDITKESDGATKKAAATLSESMAVALKETSSAWLELNIEMSKAYRPALIGFLDALASALRGIKKAMSAPGKLGERIDKAMGGGLSRRAAGLEQKAADMAADREEKRLKKVSEAYFALLELKKFIGDGDVNITADAEKKALEELALAAEETKKKVDEMTTRFAELTTEVKLSELGLRDLKTPLAEIAAESREMAMHFLAQGDMEKAFEMAEFALKIEQDLASVKQKAFELDTKASDTAQKKLDKSIKAEAAQVELLKKRKEELAEITKEIIEGSLQFQLATTAVEGFGQALNTYAGAAIDLLFQDTVDWGNVLISVLKDVMKQLATTIIRLIVIDKLMKALKLAFFLTSTGGAGAAAAGAPSMSGSLLSSAGFAASGFDGVVRGPAAMVVGEAGPERVQVTPAAKTARGKDGEGGLTVVIQGDVYGEEKFMQAVNLASQNINRNFVGV